MARKFGLHVLPIHKEDQLTIPEVPGLYIAVPPRRVSRRRAQERVIFHLSLTGNAPLSEKASQQLLGKLSEIYYQTDGSTTSAMRSVAEVLNKYLLDRNLRAAAKGLRGIGVLSMAVLRDDRLLFAQSGTSHIFLVGSDQVEELYDPELSGAGLGVSKAFKVRYHQQPLAPRQMVLISPQPPPSWTEGALKNLPRMQLSAAYQRLLHRVSGDVEALLLVAVEGTTRIRLLRPSQIEEIEEPEVPAGEAEVPRPDEETLLDSVKEMVFPSRSGQADPGEPEGIEDQKSAPAPDSGDPVPTRPIREPAPHPPKEPESPSRVPWQEPVDPLPPPAASRTRPAAQSSRVGDFLAGVFDHQAWKMIRKAGAVVGSAFGEVWKNLRILAGRILPDEQLLDLPGWVMGLTAVMVPLVMVVFGSYFYIKRGRDRLFEAHLSTAQALLAEAEMVEDPALYYQNMAAAMEELRAARNYRPTEEVEALYQSARNEVDSLDLITRVEFEPLFSRGLGPDVTISEVVVTSWNDLYLLNEDSGTVIWAQYNPDGYEIKKEFSCGPIEGHVSVGSLVDIAALPTSQEDEATILGIDQSHKMIFCFDDLAETPVIFEDTSYTLGRGPVEAITISTSAPHNLYILDPEKRAIWIEYESQNYHEGAEYFGAVDAPEMADAIDLATNGSELYILHQEGYVTKCITEKAIADPQCTTPFEFTDSRPGRESGPFLGDAVFQAFAVKSAPGPAVYMLDAEDTAIYRFSTQLDFQQQFRPVEGIFNEPATAFAVTMSDRLYLAVDDQVYSAQLLP